MQRCLGTETLSLDTMCYKQKPMVMLGKGDGSILLKELSKA